MERKPRKKLAKVHSHFIDSGGSIFKCRHCLKLVASSDGTSNMHKHLSHLHPNVQRFELFEGTIDNPEDFEVSHNDDEQKPRVSSARKRRFEEEPKATSGSFAENGFNRDEEEVEEEEEVPPEGEIDTDHYPSSTDVTSRTILMRMKQLNNDNAELQNQLLHQQYDNQNQLRMIKALRRDFVQLKKDFQNSTGGGGDTTQRSSDRDLLQFPIQSMKDIDQLEERLVTDADLKRRLLKFFQASKVSKVNSILRWIAKEILVQFTVKVDRDSLATHRSTEYSEIFQLIFRAWSTDSFTKSDYKMTIRDALETATSELAAENYARNMRKGANSESEFFDNEVDSKSYLKL